LGKKNDVSAKQIANAIINKKIAPGQILAEKLIQQIAAESKVETIDASELEGIIKKVLADNQKAVADYKSGKESVIMFLVGQTMRAIGKKVDVTFVKDRLKKSLQN
jgi:aspartyl-tRNA(Asn)/glutamyl-tRNA(Gln) amidotransferase subunit B